MASNEILVTDHSSINEQALSVRSTVQHESSTVVDSETENSTQKGQLRSFDEHRMVKTIISSEDEAKRLLCQMQSEKELFVIPKWERRTEDKPLLSTIQFATKKKRVDGFFEILMWTLSIDVIENMMVQFKEVLQNPNIVKIMFSPRTDFTNLLHYGIRLDNIFDIQSCVQCINAERKDGHLVMEPQKPFDEICNLYDVDYSSSHEFTDAQKMSCLVKVYSQLKSKDGKWFKAQKRIKFLFKRKTTRLVRLTEKQSAILHRNRPRCHHSETYATPQPQTETGNYENREVHQDDQEQPSDNNRRTQHENGRSRHVRNTPTVSTTRFCTNYGAHDIMTKYRQTLNRCNRGNKNTYG